MRMWELLILLFLFTQSIYAQSITGIETSTSIDRYIVFPYHSLTVFSGPFNIEVGYVDYPTTTNGHIQSTINSQGTSILGLFGTPIEDYGNYKKKTRGLVHYYLIGYQIHNDKTSLNIQNGYCKDKGLTLKLKPSINILNIQDYNSKVIIQLNTQFFISETNTYTFLGYSIHIGI